MHRRLRQFIFLIVVTLAWEMFVLLLFVRHLQLPTQDNGGVSRAFGLLAVAPLILWLYWLMRIQLLRADIFLTNFADANGYFCETLGEISDAYCSIFKSGGNQRVSRVARGKYHSRPIRLFNYKQSSFGGNRSQFATTIIEIKTPNHLPNALVIGGQFRFWPRLATLFGKAEIVPSDQKIRRQYVLYGEVQDQSAIMQIFTPDVLAVIANHKSAYCVELVGKYLYIYTRRPFMQDSDVMRGLTLADALLKNIATLPATATKNKQAITPNHIINNAHVRRQRIVTAVVLMVFFASVILFSVRVLTVPYQTKADVTAAEKVTDAFVLALQHSDTDSAYKLEAPEYKQVRDKQFELLSPSKYMPPSTPTVFSKAAGARDKRGVVAIVYKFNDNGKFYYVEVWAERNAAGWQVYGFRSGHDALRATYSY